MAKYIKAVLLPNMNSVLITLIASVVAFDTGVGFLNDHGRMIGWIDITATNQEVLDSHFIKVLKIAALWSRHPKPLTG